MAYKPAQSTKRLSLGNLTVQVRLTRVVQCAILHAEQTGQSQR